MGNPNKDRSRDAKSESGVVSKWKGIDPTAEMLGDWSLADSTGGSSEATMGLDAAFHGERKRGPNG